MDDLALIDAFRETTGVGATNQELRALARFLKARNLYNARKLDFVDLYDLWADGCDVAAGASTIEAFVAAWRENTELWYERIKAQHAARGDDGDEFAQEYHRARGALEKAIAARRLGELYTNLQG